MTDSLIPTPKVARTRLQVTVAIVLFAIYCLTFLMPSQSYLPDALGAIMDTASIRVFVLIRSGFEFCGLGDSNPKWVQGSYLVLVVALIPLLVTRIMLKSPLRFLGWRFPNRVGWRYVLFGYLVSLPFLVFMGVGSGMQAYYLPEIRRDGTFAFVTYYLVNMLAEHCLFHGVMLGAFRPSGRWDPPPHSIYGSPGTGWAFSLKRCLGLGGQSTQAGSHPLTSWLGLPVQCGTAILASGLLFALVHVGKDWRESLLSLPGGMFLAFIAFRGNSWLTPFCLHALTAGTTLLIMLVA